MTQKTSFILSLLALLSFLSGPQCLLACDLKGKVQAEEHACCPGSHSHSQESRSLRDVTPVTLAHGCVHPFILTATHIELLQKQKPYTGVFPDNIMQPYESSDIPWIATQEDIGKTSFRYILRPFFLQHHQWLC